MCRAQATDSSPAGALENLCASQATVNMRRTWAAGYSLGGTLVARPSMQATQEVGRASELGNGPAGLQAATAGEQGLSSAG